MPRPPPPTPRASTEPLTPPPPAVVRLLFRTLFLCFAALAGTVLAVYATGRIFTDRFHATQFLSWVPGMWLLAFATLCALVFSAGRLLSRAARLGVPERWAGRLLLVALVVGWCHFAFIEARVQRAFSGPPRIVDSARPAAPQGRAALRVMQWNATSPDVVPRPALLLPLLHRFDPDVLFACIAMAPHQLESVVSELPARLHTARRGMVLAVSKRPILDMTTYPLGLADPVSGAFVPPRPGALPPAPDRLHAEWETFYNSYGPLVGLQRRQFRNADPGFLTVLRLAPLAQDGEPLVLWHFDLPSDPLRSKWLAAGHISTRLTQPAPPGPDGAPASFGLPALIIGDFNTPRGAASLRRAFASYSSVFDAVGKSPGATWPRRFPLLQIDQALAPAATLPLGWGSVDPGEGDHLAIIVDVGLPD